jgi:c-di-AMP phosphodiesterase-like protein
MANALFELMGDTSQIFIMGHKYADLDAVGAAAGIFCIARKRGVKASIVIDPESNYSHSMIDRLLRETEYKDVFITPQEAIVKADSRSLLVVVDTNRPEQVEDHDLLIACNRVAVIDHHRRAASYIQNADLSFHEPYASSTCELVAELMGDLWNSLIF